MEEAVCEFVVTSKARYDKSRTDGTRYFFLSMVGISVLSAFSQITYTRISMFTLRGVLPRMIGTSKLQTC